MPRRKALLIGINYYGTSHELKGCINDAFNMKDYLVRDRGFSPAQHDMVMLTDAPENRGSPFYPTGANMMAAFQWLVTGNNPGDSVFLSYSGHGGRLSSKLLNNLRRGASDTSPRPSQRSRWRQGFRVCCPSLTSVGSTDTVTASTTPSAPLTLPPTVKSRVTPYASSPLFHPSVLRTNTRAIAAAQSPRLSYDPDRTPDHSVRLLPLRLSGRTSLRLPPRFQRPSKHDR